MMAQRTIVQLTDDLDGKPIPDGKGERSGSAWTERTTRSTSPTRTPKRYGTPSVSTSRAARRTGSGARSAGDRRGTGGRGSAGRGGNEASRDYDPKAVRAWAGSQGIEVSQRGRVPADLIAKFQEANA